MADICLQVIADNSSLDSDHQNAGLSGPIVSTRTKRAVLRDFDMEHYAAPFPAKFVVLYDSLGINRDIIRTTSTVVIRSRYESFPEVNTIECICGPGVARYCKAGAENDA